MADDLEALWNVLQLFGDIVTEVPQLAAALGTAIALGPVGTWLALTLFSRATRAIDAPGTGVATTMRRFSAGVQ